MEDSGNRGRRKRSVLLTGIINLPCSREGRSIPYLIERGKVRVRVIRTPLAEELSQGPADTTFRFSPDSLEEAWIGGDLAANTLPTGQITGMLEDVRPVREIIDEMVKD